MAITIATESLIFRDPPNAIELQLLRWVNGVCAVMLVGENASLTQSSLDWVCR